MQYCKAAHTHIQTDTHRHTHTQAIKKKDGCIVVPMSPRTTSSTWAMVGCLLLRNSINCKRMRQRGSTRQTTRQDLHCAYSSSSFNRYDPNRQTQGKRTGPKGRRTGPIGKPKAREQDQKAEGQDRKAKCAYLFCSLKGDDLLGLLNALLSGTAAGHSLCFVGSRLGPLAGAWTQSVLCACCDARHSMNKMSI